MAMRLEEPDLLYARSELEGKAFNPWSYVSMARWKNLMDLTASPARHLPAASSKSTPADDYVRIIHYGH